MSRNRNDSPRGKCANCGTGHRSHTGLCAQCRTGRNSPNGTDSKYALTGGQWVKRGGIRVWVGDIPDDDDYQPRPNAPACHKCNALLSRGTTCRYCIRPIVFPGRPVCVCGCLLARPDEDCPNCRVQLLEVAA